ncbi:helix-turn-helix domain-containing protein, partial [Streptococcus pyogenes]
GEAKEGDKRFRAPAVAVDYRRKQVLRLLLRGVPRPVISEHLGVPLHTIENDVREINKEMRNEIQHFDFVSYMGYSLSFYEEV